MVVNVIKEFLGTIGQAFQGKAETDRVYIGDMGYSLERVKNIYIGDFGSGTKMSFEYKWRRKHGRMFLDPGKETNPHMIIVGMSGFGKSTLLKSLMVEMHKVGKRMIVFDAHNEHSEVIKSIGGRIYDSRYSGINILALDGMTVGERISELVGVFKSMYSLGHIQTTKLSSCMWYCYRNKGARSKNSVSVNEPNVSDLIRELDVFIRNSKTVGERNTLLHLRYRLDVFNSETFKRSNVDMKNSNETMLFLTGSLPNNESRYLYMHELLQRLYNNMHSLEKETGINTYLIIDEAQFLIDESSGESGIIRRLIEEGRKYGFGVMMATHMPTRIPKAAIANASTFITFYLREPTDISYASNILGGGNPGKAYAVRNMIEKLKRNEIVIVSTRTRKPVMVRTRKIRSGNAHNSMVPESAELQSTNEPIKDSEIRKRIGKLPESKDVESIEIGENKAKERWFMRRKGNVSIEHEVCVRKISDILSKRGVTHKIIDTPNGPDIEAYRKGERIAVEYETGRKRVRKTADMIRRRRERFKHVMVVVNDSYLSVFRKGIDGAAVMPFSEAERIVENIDEALHNNNRV